MRIREVFQGWHKLRTVLAAEAGKASLALFPASNLQLPDAGAESSSL
jgi:hypothetical protein